MAKIQTYEDMKIVVKWATPNPGAEVREALTNSMANLAMISEQPKNNVSSEMLKFLFTAEHDSTVEHAVISFMIYGCSRSFLAQITRHRIASPTSSSQHYQDYSEYPMVVHESMVDASWFFLEESIDRYKNCLDSGIPKEEARQILPNASAANLKWTMNASSLHNLFRKRSCLRNVAEMIVFCNKLFPLVERWWPEYAAILGPPCHTDGKCNQGRMTCGRKWEGFRK
jgi:thymidylate synthase (FAD)